MVAFGRALSSLFLPHPINQEILLAPPSACIRLQVPPYANFQQCYSCLPSVIWAPLLVSASLISFSQSVLSSAAKLIWEGVETNSSNGSGLTQCKIKVLYDSGQAPELTPCPHASSGPAPGVRGLLALMHQMPSWLQGFCTASALLLGTLPSDLCPKSPSPKLWVSPALPPSSCITF